MNAKLNEIKSQNEFRIIKKSLYQWDINFNLDSWPAVYILSNDKDIYIGETKNLMNRLKQHKTTKKINNPEFATIILHGLGNKSLVWSLENELIRMIYLDGWKGMLNLTKPRSKFDSHDLFYTREEINSQIQNIWGTLKELHIVKNDYADIINKSIEDLAPIQSLDEKQAKIVERILINSDYNSTTLIKGAAGTGKSSIIVRAAIEFVIENPTKTIGIYSGKRDKAISSFEDALSRVSEKITKRIKLIKEINDKDFIKKFSRNSEKIDYLLIDEGQMLNVSEKGNKFGTPSYRKEGDKKNYVGNDFDQIKKNIGNNFAIFYDPRQATNSSAIRMMREFEKNITINSKSKIEITEQYRIKSEKKVEDFFWNLFNNIPTKIDLSKDQYVIEIVETVDELEKFINTNKIPNDGLSRMIASVSEAKWSGDSLENATAVPDVVFETDKHSYIWNIKDNVEKFEINSEYNEVGSIYTLQGKSLDRAGFLLGEEVSLKNGKIQFDTKIYSRHKSRLYDLLTDDEKIQLIINTNYVLSTRAKNGIAICVRDEKLRNFIKSKIKN